MSQTPWRAPPPRLEGFGMGCQSRILPGSSLAVILGSSTIRCAVVSADRAASMWIPIEDQTIDSVLERKGRGEREEVPASCSDARKEHTT